MNKRSFFSWTLALCGVVCFCGSLASAKHIDDVKVERDYETEGYVDINSDMFYLDDGDTLLGLCLIAKKSLDTTVLLRFRLAGIYHNGDISPAYGKLKKWKENNTSKGYGNKDINFWLVFSDGTSVKPEKAILSEMKTAESMMTEIFCRLTGPEYISAFEEKCVSKKITHIVVEDVWIPVEVDLSSLLKRMFNDMRDALGLERGRYLSGGVTLTGLYLPQASYLKNVREHIDSKRICKTGCITEQGRGIVFLDKTSAVWGDGIPSGLAQRVNKYVKEGNELNDVCFSDNGAWVVVVDSNGNSRMGIPYDMERDLITANSNEETIFSVCFNQKNEYIIVTNKTIYYSNSPMISSAIKKATEMFGDVIISASLSNRGVVICCENGVYYYNVPPKVSEAIKNLTFRAVRVRFSDMGNYLIVGKNNEYIFNM